MIFANTYHGGFYRWECIGSEWLPRVGPTGHTNILTDIVVRDYFIITTSLDQTTRLWVFYNGDWREISRPMVHGYDMNCIASTGLFLISGGDEKIVRVFEMSKVTSTLIEKFTGVHIEASLTGGAQALGLMTKAVDQEFDASQEITEDILSSLTLWPEQYKLYGHGYEVCTIAAGNQQPIVATACKAQSSTHAFIIIWNLELKIEVSRVEYHSLTVTDLAFSHDDNFLLSVSRDRH